MAAMWLLHQPKKNKSTTANTTAAANKNKNVFVLGNKNTRRRRLVGAMILTTATTMGILLTWTSTMRWWISAASSLPTTGSTARIADYDDWKVMSTARVGISDTKRADSASSSAFLNATSSSSSSSFVSPLDKLKVPLPIYIPSLPKSGTTSLHRYFICGQVWTAHTYVNTQDLKQMRVGECIQNNVLLGRAPLDNCGTYKVFGDDGYIRGNRCYYPSLHGALPAFARAYASTNTTNSHGDNDNKGNQKNNGGFTLLYIRRSSQAWIKSMRNWKDGNLLRKWKACDAPFPQSNNKNATTDEEWMQFYEHHAQSMRQFARDHADIVTFIEVDLEDENIAQILHEKIGIDASCWGHHNSHEKRLRLNPKFRAKAAASALQQQQQET
jgi:hypothetical protein